MGGRTIWKHWDRRARGDYRWRCDYCGFWWQRSKLRIDGSGLYVCPDEGMGEDAVTLTETNIALTPDSESKRDPGKGYY